ncbi:hypothetical protein [Flavobacterium pectinovorum]|uniref:Uncharacterized protein n=1 Tax=Flavobacterium pectinovorum TaxID=29533 RepID=A0A502EX05_9FLAO|nr:hypothetical protein [Flavobacterium pectinovorum]TPG42253.1 hypothetical protein EAH81_08020 [Flavobacterium pectinovorum]
MKKIFLIIFILSQQLVYCQNENDYSEAKIYLQIFDKCFNKLGPIPETKKSTSLSKRRFCSLYQCVNQIAYAENEKDIQEAILKRAVEITKLLYNEGTPICLIVGSMSWHQADTKNQDLTDDNNLIYVSISDCISSNALVKIAKTVNEETSRLINKK